MGKKYTYKIGDWVSFKVHHVTCSYGGKRETHEIGLVKAKTGQICGSIVRYIGDIKNPEWDYHNEAAYLSIRKAHTFYQVKDGMLNVPYEVKEENIQLLEQAGFSDLHKLPWKNIPFDKMHKDIFSKKAKSQLRDSKGRFIKPVLMVANG